MHPIWCVPRGHWAGGFFRHKLVLLPYFLLQRHAALGWTERSVCFRRTAQPFPIASSRQRLFLFLRVAPRLGSCAPRLARYTHWKRQPPRLHNADLLLPTLLPQRPFQPKGIEHGVNSHLADRFRYNSLRPFLRLSFFRRWANVQWRQRRLFPIECRGDWPCWPQPTKWKILPRYFLLSQFLWPFAKPVALEFRWDR